ncbi:hypothetical protein BD410DRAFT_199812 [Rickenella mellea]|uniref:Uncharacterized protein n=1 Tax=Rickenella mellea TaxID=50990 RepID=A0A4Y7Q668_9AGAM|nr:hypothetical protein BD410DRAFT_199812 [Rickenella mellea]
MPSPLTDVFLLHVALELPLAIRGLYSPRALPLRELNNTVLVLLKLYASLSLASCLLALGAYPIPDWVPSKRGFALTLTLYHTIASIVLVRSPRFIHMSLGASFERYKVTPELVWGGAHGFLSLAFVWWQTTAGQGDPRQLGSKPNP